MAELTSSWSTASNGVTTLTSALADMTKALTAAIVSSQQTVSDTITKCHQQPMYHLPCASYTIDVALLSQLYDSLTADAESYADLRSEFEECVGLEQGDVKRNAPLNAAFKSAVEKLNEKLDADTAEEAALEAQV